MALIGHGNQGRSPALAVAALPLQRLSRMRPWLAWSTFVLAAVGARPAAAESQLNGGVIKIELYIPKNNGDGGNAQSMDETKYQAVSEPATSTDMKRYFNAARCRCDRLDRTGEVDAAKHQLFLVKLTYKDQPTSSPGDIALAGYAGTQCDATDVDPTVVAGRCSQFATFNATALNDSIEYVFVRAGDLLAPGVTTMVANECNDATIKADLTIQSGSGTRFIESGSAFTVPFDLKAPTMPSTLTPIGLENAVRVTWTNDAAAEQPTYYQALCIRADGSPAHGTAADPAVPEPTHEAQFDSTQSTCAVAPTAPLAATLGDGSAIEGTLPDALKILDKRYLCGQNSGSASSIDLTALTNEVPYWVVVLAVDNAGNYDARYLPRPVTPHAVTDFWEDVNAENPDVGGGFCVAQVGRDGSPASALLVLGAIGVAVGRRRRGRRGSRSGALLGLGLVLLAPTAARAQNYDPYWLDSEAGATDRAPAPTWHLGLRAGPYHPAIDAAFTSSPGPFRRMFGPGYQIVPQLDLHRIWQTSALQLGVGLSGGYYAKSAEVYEANTDPADPMRPRVSGATNTFKMIPLALTGLMRLTALDDHWGFPVVPYVRGGLAYDVWWVRTPTGELAMTSCATCKDKALGASAGLIGAVGIAVRGERLDSEASHSMKNGGVEHAGFYAELETGWVDGFGNAKRLSLGDTTWYAGVDFEF